MQNYYYPRTIKGVTIALMDVFNDMVVYKFPTDNIPNEPNLSAFTSGGSVQEISVPITFGPVEKQQQSRTENHEYYVGSATDDYGYKQVQATNQRYYLQLPRLALELNGIAYNSERAYGVNEWREWFQESLQLRGSDIENIIQDYQPTPYDFNFTLHVLTDNMDYFAQIMENILPYFNPKLFLRVREFSFLNIERDLPVSMNGVNPQFISLEMDDMSKREVNATIDFTVEAYMFRPFDSSGIIKSIDNKFFITNEFDGVLSASRFETSGVLFNSAGGIDTSAIPESFTFSGTYEDTAKDFVYFTSASY
jgi:hypothetical protein